MKLRIALLALAAAAGVFASIAVAKPPQGHGGKHDPTTVASTTGTTSTTSAAETTTTTTESPSGKVLVCHKTGNGHYVLVRVSVHSALARGKHKDKGDVPAVGGTCPGTVQGRHGHTAGTTATTTTTP